MPSPYDDNPYLAGLMQAPERPHWTQTLGNLLTNVGAGIGMASAGGRPWGAGIAPGLAMASNAMGQQQDAAERDAMRRTQLALQMAAFADKRAERDKQTAADEAWVRMNGGPAVGMPQPGFQVADNPVRMGPPATAPAPVNQDEFVSMMLPHALAVSQATGVDPRLVIAQSALETGWGKAAPGNNYFGIKSHGRAGGQDLATNEVGAGGLYRTTDSFRTYGSPAQSAQDYAEFLKTNGRYAPVLQAQGLDAQIDAMGKSGYATDPNYAAKLRQIAGVIKVGDQKPSDGPPEPPTVPRPMLPAQEAAYLAYAVRSGAMTRQQAEAEKMRLIDGLWKRQQDEALARYNQANENWRFGRGQKAEQDRETRRLQTEGEYITGRDGVARFVPKSERKSGDIKYSPPTGYRVKADETMEFIPGGPADPAINKKQAPMTEGQSKDAGFADRMLNSGKIIEPLESEGTKFWSTLGEKKVWGVGIPFANYLQSEDYKKYKQAKEDWINAQLRKETGAVLGPDEFDKMDRQYFPQPGDTPAVIAQKRENRRISTEAMIRSGGPSYTPPSRVDGGGGEQAPASAQSTPKSLVVPPKPGTERDGWRFKGGDPSQRMNWERIQ